MTKEEFFKNTDRYNTLQSFFLNTPYRSYIREIYAYTKMERYIPEVLEFLEELSRCGPNYDFDCNRRPDPKLTVGQLITVANHLLTMDNDPENGGSPTDETRQCINIAYLALEALVILPMIRLRPGGMQYAYPRTGHFKEYTEWMRCETGGELDF